MADDLFDTLLGNNDPLEEQLAIYQDQLTEQQDKLDKLDGVDTPEAAQQRQQAGMAIYECQVKIQQIKHSQDQERDEIEAIEPMGFDLFDD